MSAAKPLAVPASRTWNMCMLAHVDHGKSALSDALVASNGHISARTAGHVRYMDSRADEQRRGITMKSSSIALGSRGADGELRLVNLVDSPGHVDFSGEVDAALRVCDGCLLVVDVVEGVCVQTVAVLKAALERGVVPCLVLNKVDRLFCELRLGVEEAYWRIVRVLEQVNVVMGVREVEDMMARADVGDDGEWEVEAGGGGAEATDGSSGYFSPERGNVVFASATDGWAFRVEEFAAIFAAKFGISERALRKTLWGEYVLVAKSKKIVRKRRRTGKDADRRPIMFVQCVLTSLHAVYDAVYSTANDMDSAIERRAKVAGKLGLALTNRDLRHKDAGVALRAIMAAWLPAAPALLGAITSRLPTAAEAQRDPARLAVLWPHATRSLEAGSCGELQRRAVEGAESGDGAPVLAFVTKMVEPVRRGGAGGGKLNIRMPGARGAPVTPSVGPSSAAPAAGDAPEPAAQGSGLIAFARLLSGTLSVGDTVYVYGPRYAVQADGSYDEASVSRAAVTALHLLMGRDMEDVSKASAGCVVGIAGLGEAVLKTATVSSLPPGQCLPLGSGARSSALGTANEAVVRVAVEPHLPGDVPALQAGLRKLNQADPAVDTYVTSKGEHVIAASGELHLERCLLDLRERFAAGIEIHVSPPIISFRETVFGGAVAAPLLDLHEGFKAPASVPIVTGARKGTAPVAGRRGGAEAPPVPPGRAPGDASTGGIASPGDGDPGAHALDHSRGWRVAVEGRSGEGTTAPATLAADALLSPFVKRGRFVTVGNATVSFRICAAPLPVHLAAALDEAGLLLRDSSPSKLDELSICGARMDDLRGRLSRAIEEDAADSPARHGPKGEFSEFWGRRVLGNLWSCGPRHFGSCLLVGPGPGLNPPAWMRELFCAAAGREAGRAGDDGRPAACSASARASRELESAVAAGFQLGVLSGPLCEEPVHGVAVFIDTIACGPGASAARSCGGDGAPLPSSVAGLVIGSTKEAVRLALLNASPRIMEAALKVELSVAGDALGRMYTVLAKRRGRVLAEDMKDGVNVFNVAAVLPLTESFGFAEALRKQTSGFASAQMMFSHWEAVDVDPFWSPRTEEELEDAALEDTTEASNNLARKLVTAVRRRKGLRVEGKIVRSAEKQRTLSRKK
jgi:ribosome assembly protein 1